MTKVLLPDGKGRQEVAPLFFFEVIFGCFGYYNNCSLVYLNKQKYLVNPAQSYQRLYGEDVITTPKTKKSNRMIKMPKFLCEEMQEYLQMLYGLEILVFMDLLEEMELERLPF